MDSLIAQAGVGPVPAEAGLVERAGRGDAAAFEALIAPRLDDLHRTARAITGNDADARDATQDACLAAWRQLPRLRDVRRFDAWLGKVLVNACRMLLRRRRSRVREIALADAHDTHATSDADQTAVGEAEAISRAFDTLNPDSRALLVLHHLRHQPVASIAVRAWQKAMRVPIDGVVRQSDLVYFPVLPARVAPTADLRVAARLSGGEQVIDGLSASPTFTITLGIEQATLVPLVTTVILHHVDGTWQGVIASATSNREGELVLTLDGPSGASLCGDGCATVPIAESALYTADLVVVPERTGPVVPAAALRSRPDGSVAVVAEDGREITVEVLAAAEGRAVVSGINVGARIRLFGDPAAGGGGPGPSTPPS